MKKTFYLLSIIIVICLSSQDAAAKNSKKSVADNIKKNKNMNFIHATYFLDGWLTNKEDIAQTRFDQFDIFYVMAVPHWTAKDFDFPEKDIMDKLVYNFSYATSEMANPLIPEFIKKSHENNVKVILSIPGTDRFSSIAASKEKRILFAKVMAAVVKKNNYDGIDIDWEATIDVEQHFALMNELRKALNSLEKSFKPRRKYYLTTALSVFMKYPKTRAWQLSSFIDWVNIMTYDMGGGAWGKVPTHNTPLNKMKELLRTNWSFFPKSKLCIGLANYGFYYKGISPGKKCKTSLKGKGRYFSYKELPAFLKKGWKESYDKEAEVPYYFSSDKKDFISIDNKRSITRKMEWILKEKFRGVFWWEFHHDFLPPVNGGKYATHPLIDHVSKIIAKEQKKIRKSKKNNDIFSKLSPYIIYKGKYNGITFRAISADIGSAVPSANFQLYADSERILNLPLLNHKGYFCICDGDILKIYLEKTFNDRKNPNEKNLMFTINLAKLAGAISEKL